MPPRPPRLAELLVQVLTPEDSRDPVLGDLLEVFAEKCAHETLTAARAWYWRQALSSLPYLTAWRMRGSRVLASLMALLVSYLVLAASLALFFLLFRQAYAFNLFQGAVLLALGVRLALECLAFFAGGAILGLVMATSGWREARFVGLVALVLCGLVFLPDLLAIAEAEQEVARVYLYARIAGGLPVLVTGTWIGFSARSG